MEKYYDRTGPSNRSCSHAMPFAMTHDILSCMCITFEQSLTMGWLLSPKQVKVITFSFTE